jgi:hemerythrin
MQELQPLPFVGSTTLGYAPMDRVHREFESLMAHALACKDGDLPQSIESLHAHLQAHFADEERWMKDTDFPATECHAAEHNAVLASAAAVAMKIKEGNHDLGRSFITALAEWFPAHADYLDSALAHWIVKRKNGGKPLVFHRNLSGCANNPHGAETLPSS